MKLCFSTLGCTELGLSEILSLAGRFGIPAIELRGIGGITENRLIPEYAPSRIRGTAELIAASGKEIAVIGTSCSFDDPSKLEAALEEGTYSAAAAARLGCRYIRVFGNRIRSAASAVHAASGISRLCRLTAPYGVSVLLEVHGAFNTEAALAPVIAAQEEKGLANFGLIWDIAHTDGTFGDGWPVFYERFRPYIKHVHIKDRHRGSGLLCLPGEGDLPAAQIARQLASDGFSGCVSLEWERRWHPELPPLEEALPLFTALCG